MKIKSDTIFMNNQSRDLIKLELERSKFVHIKILDAYDNEIGSVELSKADGTKYLEIRNIEIIASERRKGHSINVIEQLKDLKHPMWGTVEEDKLEELTVYWNKVGADFINKNDFVILI